MMRVCILVVQGPDEGRVFRFEERDRFVVGRSPEAQLQVVDDPYFSRHHLLVELNPPNVLLQDLGSRNGTFVNDGQERVRRTRLRHGDRIRAGTTVLEVLVETDGEGLHEQPTVALGDTPPPAPSGGLELDDLLNLVAAPAASVGGRAEVRCIRCGTLAASEEPRLRTEEVAFFCDPCQGALLEEPTLLEGYRVVRELGRGGMGAVYLALHEVLGVQRALKVILPRAAISAKARQLFLREASVQARLSHPNVVQLHELRQVRPGIFCMAMEYVEGSSAADLLRLAQPQGLPVGTAVALVAQALEGLAFAHEQGIVHRDIKPANLLVGRSPDHGAIVKVSDFGLAKSYETSGASGFTRAGEASGTVPFMAPEQILHFRDVRPAADLYSMGATLYHLLANDFPHDFPDDVDPFIVVLEHPPVPLRVRRAGLPLALEAAVDRALSPDPDRRFPSARAMARQLLAAVG